MPLHDPSCGTGTILLEAAYLRARRAPGLTRSFACENWPLFPKKEMEQLRLAHSRNSEELSAALKKEYETRTETLLAQKDAQHAAELQKLEAIQKSAMRSLEERYRMQQEQPQTIAKNSN